MSITLISIILISSLFILLGMGLWVAVSLLIVSIIGFVLIDNNNWGNIMATIAWGSVSNWTLTPLPMFIWMGEILFRSNLSKHLFDGLSVFLSRVPGKLFHVNTLSCGIFSSVSGSSAATVAAVGKITLSNLKRLGYKESFSIGLLGGTGTLGLLIPPSIMLIIYAVAANVSVSRLFMAGVLPGLLLISLFIIYTIIYCFIYPDSVPKNDDNSEVKSKRKALLNIIPVLSLTFVVLGSIYTGIATPNESAALGVLGALLLSWTEKSLTIRIFIDALLATVKTTSMLMLIIVAATVLSSSMGFIGLPSKLASLVSSMNLSPGMLILVLSLLFVILGCFLDGISVILLTTAVVLPMIKASGIDLIWFGIYLVLIVEMSQITPPVGFNLFILQSLTGKDMLTIAKYTMPSFFIMVLTIFIIWFFPEIATYLPSTMNNQ